MFFWVAVTRLTRRSSSRQRRWFRGKLTALSKLLRRSGTCSASFWTRFAGPPDTLDDEGYVERVALLALEDGNVLLYSNIGT